MMEVVPDKEEYGASPALRPPSEPAPVDPEQLRQFQQFQQFQELMRQQGNGAPPLLPPARKPLWQRILGGKLVRRLILLAIVLATIPLWLPLAVTGVAAVFSTGDDDRPASETGGGTNETNVLHEKTPKRTVRQVYSHIAQADRADNEYVFVCGQFQDGAEARFAHNFGAGTCQQVVAKLHGDIDKSRPSWRNSYAEPFTGAELGEEPIGDTATVDTCELSLQPRLGVFSLQRINNDQWVITGHDAC